MEKMVVAVFCLLLLFTACDKDEKTVYESDFEGNDNRIVSFALISADGERFPAAIKNDEIIISLPSGLEMGGIKPEYQMSENATLQPDPNNISDWLQEYRFLVTSYSLQSRVYCYRVNLTGHGNMLKSYTLKTQEEVDAFAENDVTEVLDLTIGTNDLNASKITNLKGLSKLKKVTGNLEIASATFTGDNVEGLYALESVGSISVSCNSIYLPALKTITLKASFSECIDIDLPKLTETGGDLWVNAASAGTELIKLPLLQQVGGELRINGGYKSKMTVLEMPELVSAYILSLQAFPSLTTLQMPHLQEIYQVRINYLTGFSDFSFFAPFIPLLDNEHWRVMNSLYNPTYQDMVDGKYTNQQN